MFSKYRNSDITKKHIEWLPSGKNAIVESDVQIIQIGSVEAKKYEGDLHGLLISIGVTYRHLDIHTTFNGFKSSGQFDGLKFDLKVINIDKLNTLYKLNKKEL